MGLSQRELDMFNRDGWAGPFKLVEPEVATQLLARIRDEILPTRCDIYAHTHADLAVAEYKRDRHLDSPLMSRMARAPAIVSRLPGLIGPNVVLWRSDVFEQGPGDRATSPHQDGAFEATRATHPMIEVGESQASVAHQVQPVEVDIPLSIGCWIALTTVTKQTGALWVVPGSHKELIVEVPGDGFAGMKYVPISPLRAE